MPGRGRSKKWWRVYHALRTRRGHSKRKAARIASSRTKKR